MIKFHSQEFEEEVCSACGCTADQLGNNDLLRITELDCSNFTFMSEDSDTLSRCRNLKALSMDTYAADLYFLSELTELETLNIVIWNHKNEVDFRYFSDLKKLKYLYVSGGDISDIAYTYTEGLVPLENLRSLYLHEFGSVDLKFLEHMPRIKNFFCGYANDVKNSATIGSLSALETLRLVDFEVESLSFLDSLPDSLELELCALRVKNGIDTEKLRRFRKLEICDAYAP